MPSRAGRRQFPGHRGRPARPARHRRLYGGGDRRDRLRPAGRGGRRQCRAGHVAARMRSRRRCRRPRARFGSSVDAAGACRATRRLRPGDDGSRRDDLHAEAAALHALPAATTDCRALAAGRSRAFPRQRCRRPKSRCGAARPSSPCAHDGAVLLRKRPEKGLLGGMTEVPTTGWTARQDGATGHGRRPFRRGLAALRHDQPRLHPFRAAAGCLRRRDRTAGPRLHGMFWSVPQDLPGEALPTVMKKAIEAALPAQRSAIAHLISRTFP